MEKSAHIVVESLLRFKVLFVCGKMPKSWMSGFFVLRYGLVLYVQATI